MEFIGPTPSKRSIMEKYKLTIRVDREQEEAVRAFFSHNDWNFEKIGNLNQIHKHRPNYAKCKIVIPYKMIGLLHR